MIMVMILMCMLYMFFLMILSFSMFMYFYINKLTIYLEFELMNLSSIKLEMLILLDWISLLYVSMVLMISMSVILYSMEYMKHEKNFIRFMMLLLMFMFSMLLMILSPNLISILLGWDGLGLSSYYLVIYYQSKKSYNSGMITILSNRLGDILILLSISMMIYKGSWNFMFLNELNNMTYFMLMIASFTKSAQIPFSSWLPMAMAAPTPVSSLVHSSTLVTAGVYFLIRLNYIFINEKMLYFMMLTSILTMFLSGLGANFEYDLKKIIALSTLSQLSMMIFCLSMKLTELALFHLLMHAMYKSMLFMCAGVIIHNNMGKQDIRHMSIFTINLPLVSVMFIGSILSLCGIPFMSGFFSKDLILEMFLMNNLNKIILMILFISMGLTIMYSIRLIYYLFIKYPMFGIWYIYPSNNNSFMTYSMFMLFIMSIIMGTIMSWMLFSMKNWIYLTIQLKMFIYLFILLGILMGMYLSIFFNKWKLFMYMNNYMKFLMMLWFMPMLYESSIQSIMMMSNKFIMKMELGWIEYLTKISLNNFLMKLFKLDFFYENYLNLMILFMLILNTLFF